ncbi:MAG: hypothetical protein PF484_06700 [Bacteroidales bacterium]|jgi:hypothetical protein|nr:hypothetical protein [Bacteroidales bacterium]
MTQKEAFLKYLQRMDIGMLEMILDDSIIYFGASKKVFFGKAILSKGWNNIGF